MASFTNIPNTDIAQDKPIKQETGLALRDNPVAIAEGGAGAPKIAAKVVWATGATVTLTDLDDFQGVLIFGTINKGTANALSVFFSDDNGSSFSSEEIVAEWGSGSVSFQFWLDFATGDWVLVSTVDLTPGGGFLASGTLAGSSAAITDLRLDSNTGDLAVIAQPNGGQSAT